MHPQVLVICRRPGGGIMVGPMAGPARPCGRAWVAQDDSGWAITLWVGKYRFDPGAVFSD